jgi:hypothetical protein
LTTSTAVAIKINCGLPTPSLQVTEEGEHYNITITSSDTNQQFNFKVDPNKLKQIRKTYCNTMVLTEEGRKDQARKDLEQKQAAFKTQYKNKPPIEDVRTLAMKQVTDYEAASKASLEQQKSYQTQLDQLAKTMEDSKLTANDQDALFRQKLQQNKATKQKTQDAITQYGIRKQKEREEQKKQKEAKIEALGWEIIKGVGGKIISYQNKINGRGQKQEPEVSAQEAADAYLKEIQHTDTPASASAQVLPEDWKEYTYDTSSKKYYHNATTNETQWDFPSATSASAKSAPTTLPAPELDFNPTTAIEASKSTPSNPFASEINKKAADIENLRKGWYYNPKHVFGDDSKPELRKYYNHLTREYSDNLPEGVKANEDAYPDQPPEPQGGGKKQRKRSTKKKQNNNRDNIKKNNNKKNNNKKKRTSIKKNKKRIVTRNTRRRIFE